MRRSVSIVGAGRVGKSLGRALRQRGWRIGAVVARSDATARAAVRVISGGTAHGCVTAEALAADLVLIATPDDAIAAAARDLAGVARAAQPKPRALRGKIVLHTSGALDCRALAPLAKLGAATGSLHPMQTFSGKQAPNLRGIVFAIEGDAQARRAARSITRELGGVPVTVTAGDKPAYHAAGALAAGHALALVEAATRVLQSAGFPRRRAEQTLLPLIRQALENFERIGPRAAWTGPVARGDYATVARHLRALRKYPSEFAEAYVALARLGARVLAGNPGAKLREVDRALNHKKGPRASGAKAPQAPAGVMSRLKP